MSPRTATTRVFPIIRWKEGTKTELEDRVIVEELLNIYYNDKPAARIPCTPIHMKELIYGMLLSSGQLSQANEIKISITDNKAELTGSKAFSFDHLENTSDCFTRGAAEAKLKTVKSTASFKAETISRLAKEFQTKPGLFKSTGGTHSAALAVTTLEVCHEDISRRNAVFKVLGEALLKDIPLAKCFLISSGRISSDFIYAAVACGIPLVASLSAPTDKAIILAQATGLTLCGFVRGRRLNIYSNPKRIQYE